MTSEPTNCHQLQKRIEHEFGLKYNKKQGIQLAANLIQYFAKHQFDEWNDIYEDIHNGYDYCCCKIVLFEQLNITNIKQKQDEYSTLKQCLQAPTITIPPSISNNKIFAQIFKDILKVFNIIFNATIANHILQLLNNILEKEGFDDTECVEDDVEDIESSIIITYVTQEIDYRQINLKKEIANNIIADGIQNIVQNKANQFIKQYQIKPLSLFDKIIHRMQNIFIIKFSRNAANVIVAKTFAHLTQQNQFYDPDIITQDLQKKNESQILDNILNETHELQSIDRPFIAENVVKIIHEECVKRKKFDVTVPSSVNFKIAQQHKSARAAMNKYCSIVYPHAADGIYNVMIIAKSIDMVNRLPLMIWFLDLFCRQRIKGHQENYVVRKLSYEHDRFVNDYDVRKWWKNDNSFCRFITDNDESKTADTMIEAIKLVSRRILPPLNFNNTLANTLCDSMNAFARYTLYFHSFARHIVDLMGEKKFAFAPVQFDIWIVPQATCASKKHVIFDLEEVYGVAGAAKMKNVKRTYNEMGKASSFAKAQNAFWNLEIYLKKSGYVKNKDYLVAEVKENVDEQMFSMWNARKLCLAKKRYKRCIFIIDRRNPKNLQQKNMGYVKPQIDIPDKNGNIHKAKKTWKDKIYFIIPKKYNEIKTKFDIFPEQSLGLSTKYIFPNPDKREPDDVKILDALNGYKFAFSYHLFSQNNCSTYWYINQGSTRFYLQDMKWLWPRFFDQVNDKTQVLCQKILDDIDYYNIYKQLPADNFDEFVTQTELKKRPKISIQPKISILEVAPEAESRSVQDVIQQIGEYFRNKLGVKIGNHMAELFEVIVNEEEFEDLETIQDDMDDIEESIILVYIVEGIETELNSNNCENEKRMVREQIREIVMRNIPLTINNNANPPTRSGMITKDDIQQCILNCLLPLRKPIKKLRPRNDIIEIFNGEEKEMHIEKIRRRTVKQFTIMYNENLAMKILDRLNVIIVEQIFDFEKLWEDIQKLDSSQVLNGLDELKPMLKMDKHDMHSIKIELQEIINNIKIRKPYFNIVLFNFNITKHDVESTSTFINKHCASLYKTKSKSLFIAKSIDDKNLKPFMYWLLYLYSKERTTKYGLGYLNIKHEYSCNDWWLQNQYCQWMEKTHPIIAKHIKTGHAELTKRLLIPINYNYTLFPIISDRLNDFAKYALVFYKVAHRIKFLIHQGELNVAPIQIDYWIIPQMTRKKSKYVNLTMDGNDIWNIENILKDKKVGYIKGKNYFMENAAPYNKLEKQICHMIIKYCELNVRAQRRNRFVFIIDRRHPDNLRLKNLSQKAIIETKKTWSDTIYMIGPKQYHNDNGEALCICNVKLNKLRKNKINKINKNIECACCGGLIVNVIENGWYCPKKDVFQHRNGYYLCSDKCEKARAETYGKLAKEWEYIPESCLSLSKKYIFCNPSSNNKGALSVDDEIFALSFHILRQDNIFVYWYNNGGGTAFELNNIKTLWPQLFETINGKKQQLDTSVIDEIDNCQLLPNAGFAEFEKQCNDIDI